MSTRFIVAAAAAAVVGYFSGDYYSAAQTFAVVYGATGFLDPNIKVTGPRLEDLKNTKASYGEPITWVAGHPRVAGNIAWSSEKREIASTEEQEKGGPGTDTTTFTYEQDLLIVLCENTGYRPRRCWSNGKLIWSAADTADGETVQASSETDAWREIRMYAGEPDQMPDPTYEAALGVGNAPANRGRSTVMLVGVNLGGSGYPPAFTFEISSAAVDETTGFVERFDDGLDDYSLFGGGMSSFEIVAGPYGDALHIIGGPITAVASSIGRSFPAVEFTTASWDFKLDPPGTGAIDDAGLIDIGGVIAFTPAREAAIDSARRAMLQIDGSPTFVTDSLLADGIWYSARLSLLSETACRFTISETDSGNLVNEVTIAVASSTFTANQLFFSDQSSVGGGWKPGASYDNVVVGQSSISIPLVDAPLDEVVSEQCIRAGLTADDIDVSQLEGQFVRSIGVGQVASARATIDALASVFFFESVDDGDKIVFVPRGGAAVAALTLDQLGASSGGDLVEPLPITRGNEIESAAQVVVNYANVDNDHQDGSERSDRLATSSSIVSVVQAPVGLTPNEAARVAAKAIQDIASGIMRVGPLSLSRAAAAYLPTDVVTVRDQFNRVHRIRLLKRTDSGGVLSFEAVFDDASAMESAAETSNNYWNSEQVRRPSESVMEIFDAPLLRDADNYLGQLAAIKWTHGLGSTLFESVDGVAYAQKGTVTRKATLGSSTDALADWAGGNVFDKVSKVTVDVGDGELANWTRVDVFSGAAPGYMLGAEVFYALTADMQSAGVYELSDLLRGQRGTEWATTGHAVSEPFVVLSNNGLIKVAHTPADLNVEHQFKAVTATLRLADATPHPATDTGVVLKPFSPINLRASRNSSGLLLTWDRRTRLASDWMTGSIPLGEETESYEVDVFDAGTDELLRAIGPVATATATYSPADQAADGVTSSTALRLTVYQLSATVGRGVGASLETNGGYASTPGEFEIEVGGTFASGRMLYAFVNGLQAQHMTILGDTNLTGAATSLAAEIDALTGFSASAAGTTITVQADAGGPVTLSTGVLEPSLLAPPVTTQIASGVSAGAPEVWRVDLAVAGGAMPPGTYRLLFTSTVIGQIAAQFSTTAWFSPFTILAGLCADATAGPPGATYGITATNYGTYARVEFPLGAAGWSASGATVSTTAFADVRWASEQMQAALPIVLAPQPQVSYVGVSGVPVAGDTHRVTVNGTDYTYTALLGDDGADVAAALATLIDADAAVIATDVSGTTPPGLATYPGLVRITGASNAVPFTITTSTDTTITLTVNVINPGA